MSKALKKKRKRVPEALSRKTMARRHCNIIAAKSRTPNDGPRPVHRAGLSPVYNQGTGKERIGRPYLGERGFAWYTKINIRGSLIVSGLPGIYPRYARRTPLGREQIS